MLKVKDICRVVEAFAPLALQEDYDNAGLQVGDAEADVSAILLCLDVTEETVKEAKHRGCNLIISHHPLIFKGLKNLTGADQTQRIVMEALKENIAIYAAHTNLDSATEGVSYEMARMLNIKHPRILVPSAVNPDVGLGIIGEYDNPVPQLEFLRKVKDTFAVKALRYSAQSQHLVVKRVALCGGSGSSFIGEALKQKADAYLSGDFKYHDYTTYGLDILIADIGHHESELCSRRILSRIIREAFPECITYFAECETNPIKIL